jgi:ABC-2 type transport system ATP-binding protein
MNEAGPTVSLTSVKRKLGNVMAVNDMDLMISKGELFGLVGPDGAGKTTTIRLIAGLTDADSGTVMVLGHPQQTENSLVRESVGYMPQQYSLYGDLSVQENMDFFGRLFGLKRKERKAQIEHLLNLVGLARFPHRRAEDLSGGMYKKLALSCALLHRPELLVLDEPTNGVDPVSRRELWTLLYELVADGITVVVSTPDMDEAARCHRIALMHEGRILAMGEPGALVAALKHRVLSVGTSKPAELETALLARDDVFDCTPDAGRLRVLVRGEGEDVQKMVRAFAGTVDIHDQKPKFEDVFLALIRDPAAVSEAA